MPECGRNGEQRTAGLCTIRRGQAKRRKHEKEKGKAWRSHKDDRKLGGALTETEMRRNETSTSAAILPLFGDGCSSARAWVGAKIGVGEFGEGRGDYLKPPRRAGHATAQNPRGRCSNSGRVRPGHEVGEGSDN